MMKPDEWRKALGEPVRELFQSPEMEQFYAIPMTTDRAKLYLSQLGIYVRQRRHYWPQVAANCPEFVVKRRIMSHEHEELVEDEYSEVGHLDLIFRQARELGMSEQDILEAEPLATTKAATYGWWWIARTRPWQEALAASTIAEWTNDDRLLGDIGGGNCGRLYDIWTRDLKFTDEQVPNFTAHRAADEKHAEMFLDIFERFVPRDAEANLLKTARDSMDLHRAYFGGMAAAMTQMN